MPGCRGGYLIRSIARVAYILRPESGLTPGIKHLNTNANIVHDKARRTVGAEGDSGERGAPRGTINYSPGGKTPSPGASITEAQRAASLCGATWQSARVFDKGGGHVAPGRTRSISHRLSALSP